MRGFDPAFMAELKARNNIVDVIGSYVSLDRKGNNYWACCPFHHEKTPSFSVNAYDQFYHCFGCGASGDVIKFVEEIESVDFVDAVKVLADRVGLAIPESDINTEEIMRKRKRKENMLKIMLESAKFYRNNLYSGEADEHVEYLSRRKILPSTIKRFGLGASLDFKTLPQYLLGMGFSREDMLLSGVVSEGKNGSLYDSQAERLIIPIINAFDEVIAFGGRLLKKADFAKYKNTKETEIFNKSKSLYNVNLLKKLKKAQTIQNVIMVEGYMDAITLYQAGFTNVVASMGTSLTQDQARLVKRYSDNVLISYDGDFAGQKANSRGMDIFRNEGLNVKVVPLPDGLDPDDVVKELGAEKYKECLSMAMPLVDYALYSTEKKYDLAKPEEKRAYVAEALKIIRNESEATVREELIANLSKKTGLSVNALDSDLGKVKEAPSVSIEEDARAEVEEEWTKDLPLKVVESMRFILASKLFGMEYAAGYVLRSELFVSDVHIIISDYITDCEREKKPPHVTDIFDYVNEGDKELGRIFDLYAEDKLLGADAGKYFKDCVKTFEIYMIKQRIRALATEASKCEDEDEKKFIFEKISELTVLLCNRNKE